MLIDDAYSKATEIDQMVGGDQEQCSDSSEFSVPMVASRRLLCALTIRVLDKV